MTEFELLVALIELHKMQQKVLTSLLERSSYFLEEDDGDIERAVNPALAYSAVKKGDFHLALKIMGGAE